MFYFGKLFGEFEKKSALIWVFVHIYYRKILSKALVCVVILHFVNLFEVFNHLN